MYPLEFRPNTLVHTYKNDGTLSKAAAPCQLFRPMLSLEFNGLPANWDRQTLPGSAILRFAISDSAFAHQLVGPQHWQQTDMPFFTLNEDPVGDIWDVTDGVCWSSSPDDILSGFASKRLLFQDAATFIAAPPGGVAANLANPRLEWGRVYRRTFLAAANEWYNLYPQPGVTYAYHTLSETIAGPAYVTVKGFDGTFQNPANRWSTGGAASLIIPATTPFLQGAPINYVQFNNTTGINSDTTFVFLRMLSQLRKV